MNQQAIDRFSRRFADIVVAPFYVYIGFKLLSRVYGPWRLAWLMLRTPFCRWFYPQRPPPDLDGPPVLKMLRRDDPPPGPDLPPAS